MLPCSISELKRPKCPSLGVLGPFPTCCVKNAVIQPSISLCINKCDGIHLTVIAVPLDPATQLPRKDCRLLHSLQGLNQEFDSQHPAVVTFDDLRIVDSSRTVFDTQIGFCCYDNGTFPPTLLGTYVASQVVRVYNTYDELPAPEVIKIVPNRILANELVEVVVYGRMLNKKVTCSIANLGKELVNHESLPLMEVQTEQTVDVENGVIRLSLIAPKEGTVLINVSNDGKNYGIGKILHVQPVHEESVNNLKIRNTKTSTIHTSVIAGDYNRVQTYLDEGVDADIVDSNGWTPLCWAAIGDQSGIAELLIDCGASMEFEDSFKETPLHLAARNGSTDTLHMLLTHGADASKENKDGQTALILAAIAGHVPACEALLNSHDIARGDKRGYSALIYAIMCGKEEVATMLVQHCATQGEKTLLSSCDSLGYTPLHWCAALCREKVAKLLLNQAVQVDALDTQGETPLFVAVKYSNEPLVKLLLDSGADVHIRNNVSRKVLSYATTPEIRRLLGAASKNFTVQSPVQVTKFEVVHPQQKNLVQKQRKRVNFSDEHSANSVPPPLLAQLEQQLQPSQPKQEEQPPELKLEATKVQVEPTEPTSDREEDDSVVFELKGVIGKGTEKPEVNPNTMKRLTEIKLKKGSTLAEARKVIQKLPNFPKKFSFYFSKMESMVEDWQEERLKAEVCGNPLVVVVQVSKPQNQVTDATWWAQTFDAESVPLDRLVTALTESFNFPGGNKEIDQEKDRIVAIALKDFFGGYMALTSREAIYLEDLRLFLKLYGPLNNFKQHLYDLYILDFFHGFVSYEEAKKLLNVVPGGYLLRYSQSKLEEGCFVLNVNKGQGQVDNYVVKYYPETEQFRFNNVQYTTLEKFTADPIYGSILVQPVANRGKFRP